jgi:hypothetical protein
VPVLTSLHAARKASSGRRPRLAFGHSGTGSPRGSPRSSPALRSHSLAVRALLRPPPAPSAPPREVPGFGAVLIARPAGVMNPGAGLPRISARCPSRRPVARQPSPSEPARGQAVDRRHVFGCLLDREGSESPLSPRSLPIRLDPEGSRFRLSPHPVPLEFLPVPEERDPRHGTRVPVGDTCAATGTRWELGGEPIGGLASPPTRQARWCHAATATACPLAVRFRIASITLTKARDGLRSVTP